MSSNISDFSNVLKDIIKNSGGKDSLRDKRKTRNLLSDLAPGDKFQKEKKLLEDAYSCNAVGILLDADSSADRHQKAVEAAKTKLVDNMSLSEAGAISILKDICDALDWNTSQLFGSVQQQSAVSKNRPAFQTSAANTAVSEAEQYRQAYSQPYDLPSKVNQSTAVNTQSATQTIPVVPEQKKKSKVGTVLKVIGVLLVISVIYNAITGNTGDDNIVEDIQDTQVVTETYKPSAENNNSEADGMIPAVVNETSAVVEAETSPDLNEDGIISPDGLAANAAESQGAVAPVATTEATTTADPSEGKYVVYDIVKLSYKINKTSYFSPTFMTYSSDTNSLYYISDSGNLQEYNISSKSDDLILSREEIIKNVKEDYGYSLEDDDITIRGVVYNSYSKKVYVYGILKPLYTADTWVYEAESGNICRFQNDILSIHFFNNDEFVATTSPGHGSGWYTVNFKDRESNEWHSAANDGKVVTEIFEVNDYYYCITANYSSSTFDFYEISNINLSNSNNKLFSRSDSAYGKDVKSNEFYFKDSQNNILKINLNDLSEEKYISLDQIYQTGKSFLSENSCAGLYITNNGGFITYDTADGKIKYVAMNY